MNTENPIIWDFWHGESGLRPGIRETRVHQVRKQPKQEQVGKSPVLPGRDLWKGPHRRPYRTVSNQKPT